MENILFTAVARGNVIISTHSTDGTTYEREVMKLLDNPIQHNEQCRMNHLLFTFYRSNNLIFVCVTSGNSSRQLPFQYLEALSSRWNLIVGDKGNSAGPHSLTGQTKELFDTVLSQVSESSSKTEKIKRDLDQTQKIVTESVQMALKRDNDLNHLSSKTEGLMSTSEDFRMQATNLKNKNRWLYYKSIALKLLIIIILLYLIISFICGGIFLKPRCRK